MSGTSHTSKQIVQLTEDEKWRHDNHWDSDEVAIVVAGAGGQMPLLWAVPPGKTRRIREVTVRHMCLV